MSNEKILLVEDNPVEALGLTQLLEQQGYTVIQAGDAKEAMKAVRSEQPNLVLLDIDLPPKDIFASPKWDGLDFLMWMYSMTETSVPVIVQTGLSIGEIQRRLGNVRVAACFQKPAPLADLMGAIRFVLEEIRAAA